MSKIYSFPVNTSKEKMLRGKKREQFWAEEFTFLVENAPVASGLTPLKKENVLLKRKNLKLEEKLQPFTKLKIDIGKIIQENFSKDTQCKKLKSDNIYLQKKLSLKEKENCILKDNNDRLSKEKSALLKEKSKLLKKLHRLETKCSSQNNQHKELASNNKTYEIVIEDCQKNLDSLEKNFNDSKIENKELKAEKKQLLNKVAFMKEKLAKIKVKDVDNFQTEIQNLSAKVETLNNENKELQELMVLLDDKNLSTFEGGKYNEHIRKAIMKLVGIGVPINKIDVVIKSVLGSLTPIDIEKLKLPSIGTKTTIVKQALCLAQLHLVEEMTEAENIEIGNCLHGDGTTKYSKHYQNFQITTKSGKTLSFGLNEVADSDATSVLNSFISSIQDLVDVLNGDKEKDFAKLVSSITNTMSDMGPVNPLFNKKLQAFRENLLPTVIDKWDELPQEKKNSLIEMGNFFCKLHLLTNFATETDKILKDFEEAMVLSDHENKFAFKTKEAGPVQTVRIAAKALDNRGSDECGVASEFNSYLFKKGREKKIVSFVGNRFNILFYNGAAVYYHLNDITHFINTTFSSPNRLILSLDELIKNKFNIACVRALGIAGKVVTSPFWRIIESIDNILSMNKYLRVMKDQLIKFSQDTRPVLAEESVIWDETDPLVKIDRDELYQSLFMETFDSELDSITIQALEQIFLAMLIILERQADDQLTGGKYGKPSDALLKSSSNVPAHNKASESDFGLLDLLMRLRPNANVETFQTLIMWSRNKTADWLDSKSDAEQKILIEKAMSASSNMSVKYKDRKEMLRKRKLEILEEKMLEKNRLEERKVSKKAAACQNINNLNVTVWLNEKEALEKLSNVDQKLLVLGYQLDFYRDVLLCDRKLPRVLFTKSEGGKKLDVDQLFEKLIYVINLLSTKEDHHKNSNVVLKPHQEREEAYKLQKEKLCTRIYKNRLASAIKKKNQIDLAKIYKDPNCLIDCTIQHRMKEGNLELWACGKVLSVNKTVPENPQLSSYAVLYTGETDESNVKLIKNMEKGNCFVQIAPWK